MSVGSELRRARQDAGLTREDVAARTKIQLAKIEALEQDALSRLPQGIYLSGMVRAYAQEVGLDGQALVRRLSDGYVDEPRAVQVDSWQAAEPPASGTTPGSTGTSDFADDWPDDPQVIHVAAVPSPELDEFEPEHDGPRAGSPDDRPAASETLATAAPLAAAGIAADAEPGHDALDETYPGAAAVVPSTADADVHEPAPATVHQPIAPPPWVPNAAATPQRRAGRYALPVLALIAILGWGLYLRESLGNGPAPGGDTYAVANAPATAAGIERQPEQDVTLAPDTGGAPPPAQDSDHEAAIDLPSRADAAPRTVSISRSSTAATPPDLSGTWMLATEIETTSYRNFDGLRLGYQLRLAQDGRRITGTGQKISENGRPLAGAGRTPILVEGMAEDGRVTLTFTERGRRRVSNGRFILQIDEQDVLRGRFSSSAARSTGRAEARRKG